MMSSFPILLLDLVACWPGVGPCLYARGRSRTDDICCDANPTITCLPIDGDAARLHRDHIGHSHPLLVGGCLVTLQEESGP
jgi:hypothetical protein